MHRHYLLGMAHAQTKLGLAGTQVLHYVDPVFTVAQGAGLEALKSEEDARRDAAISGGLSSAGTMAIEDVPWQSLFRKRRYLQYL